MSFAVKKAKCIGCKASVDPKNGYLCKHCALHQAGIYKKEQATLQEAELRDAEVWSAAQRIHNTVHSDIMYTGEGVVFLPTK
jgi:DNA polymerase delta subunit 1